MKTVINRTITFILMTFLISGCLKDKKSMQDSIAYKMDKQLGKAVTDNMSYDLLRLQEYQWETKSDSWFNQAFGIVYKKYGGLYIADYLDQRINYLLPVNIDVVTYVPGLQAILDHQNYNRVFNYSQSDSRSHLAMNLGLALFYISMQFPEQKLVLKYKSAVIQPNNPRSGIVLIDQNFFGQSYVNPRIGSIHRLPRVIHEARHSDCTGGLDETDRQLIKSGQYPANLSCGHLHNELCEIEGIQMMSCESIPWGANAIEAIYSSAIAEACVNCSELERQIALANAAMAWQRVTIKEDLLKGHYGTPDMSSQLNREMIEKTANISTLRQIRNESSLHTQDDLFEILPAEEL